MDLILRITHTWKPEREEFKTWVKSWVNHCSGEQSVTILKENSLLNVNFTKRPWWIKLRGSNLQLQRAMEAERVTSARGAGRVQTKTTDLKSQSKQAKWGHCDVSRWERKVAVIHNSDYVSWPWIFIAWVLRSSGEKWRLNSLLCLTRGLVLTQRSRAALS